MELTPRLLKIAQEIRSDEKVGDIGTDHGYLPIYLIKNRIANSVIATDINQEPLNAAWRNIKTHGLEACIKTKLGAGTIPLEKEVLDVVIVAGMGGKLIAEILKNSYTLKRTVNRLILQPMQQQAELRRYLFEEGYCIEKDLLVEEGRRIYEILVVSLGCHEKVKDFTFEELLNPGGNTEKIAKNYPEAFRVYQDLQWELGFRLFDNPKNLVEKFLDQRILQMEKIVRETAESKSSAAIQMNQKAGMKAEKLKEVKQCL